VHSLRGIGFLDDGRSDPPRCPGLRTDRPQPARSDRDLRPGHRPRHLNQSNCTEETHRTHRSAHAAICVPQVPVPRPVRPSVSSASRCLCRPEPTTGYPVPCCSQQQILGARRHWAWIATELAGLYARSTLGSTVIGQRAVVSGSAMAVRGLLTLLPAALAVRWTPERAEPEYRQRDRLGSDLGAAVTVKRWGRTTR